jgi:hypothetical protein
MQGPPAINQGVDLGPPAQIHGRLILHLKAPRFDLHRLPSTKAWIWAPQPQPIHQSTQAYETKVSGHTARAPPGGVRTRDQPITGRALYQLHRAIHGGLPCESVTEGSAWLPVAILPRRGSPWRTSASFDL